MSDRIGTPDLGWITDPQRRDYADYHADAETRRVLAAIDRSEDVDAIVLTSMVGLKLATRTGDTRGELTDLGRERLA